MDFEKLGIGQSVFHIFLLVVATLQHFFKIYVVNQIALIAKVRTVEANRAPSISHALQIRQGEKHRFCH